MAEVPIGSALIDNPVSKAPGFQMGNVYVMAGVPSIMRAMFDGIAGDLKGGAKMLSKTVVAYLPEGTVAEGLGRVQDDHPDTEIDRIVPVLQGRQVRLFAGYPGHRSRRIGCGGRGHPPDDPRSRRRAPRG